MQNWTRWRHNAEVGWIIYRLNHAAWMLVTDADLCFSLDMKSFTLLILFLCNTLGVNMSHLGKQTHPNCIFGRCLHIFFAAFLMKCLLTFIFGHFINRDGERTDKKWYRRVGKQDWELAQADASGVCEISHFMQYFLVPLVVQKLNILLVIQTFANYLGQLAFLLL